MKIQIPKDQAIKILQDRLYELNNFDLYNKFNPKVWKDRTILDLKQIFGVLGDQWLQISAIHFDTIIESQKDQKLREGKETAKGLLKTYINYIEEYSKIEAQHKLIKEKDFEDKYYSTLKEYNEIAEELHISLKEQGNLLEENENLTIENQRLMDNTLQLDNVSMKKLWAGIQNLPTGQFWTLVTISLGLLYGSFSLGQYIEGLSSKSDSFEIRMENAELKSSAQTLQTLLDSIESQLSSTKPLKTTKDTSSK